MKNQPKYLKPLKIVAYDPTPEELRREWQGEPLARRVEREHLKDYREVYRQAETRVFGRRS